MNRKADHTCTGIRYENFEYPESFINHIPSKNLLLSNSFLKQKTSYGIQLNQKVFEHVKKEEGGGRKIYQKLTLLYLIKLE